MGIVDKIVAIVERLSPGLLDRIAKEDGISKEGLVGKVLSISHGRMVRTHQKTGHDAAPALPKGDEEE